MIGGCCDYYLEDYDEMIKELEEERAHRGRMWW